MIMRDVQGNPRGFGFVDGFFESVPFSVQHKTGRIEVKDAIPLKVEPVQAKNVGFVGEVAIPVFLQNRQAVGGKWADFQLIQPIQPEQLEAVSDESCEFSD